jgi:hypothetical protein
MKYSLVVLCLAAILALASASPLAVTAVPLDQVRHQSRVPVARPETPFPASANNERAELSAGLARLDPGQRANARLTIDIIEGTPELRAEARAIEQLWNAGSYDAALARLHDLGNLVDPARVLVGVNWRTPLASRSSIDWDGNVQIGRDSIQYHVFDYHLATGKLVVGTVRLAGSSTGLDLYLSTDNGSSWSETYDGYWGAANTIGSFAGACHGDHVYLGYLFKPIPTVFYCERFKMSDGTFDTFPGGAGDNAMFTCAAPESIVQGAMTSFEDQAPGQRLYAAVGTNQHNVYAGFTKADGDTWYDWNTAYLNGTYNGGLAATTNPGYTRNYVYFSYAYAPTDTTWAPIVSWVNVGDTVGGALLNVYSRAIYGSSVAVRSDSIIMAYDHYNGTTEYPREIYSPDNGVNWYLYWIPGDTSLWREQVNISSRRNSNTVAAYRERSAGSPRYIMFTSCPGMSGSPWATPDTTSDTMPWNMPVTVQPLTPGVYGVTYESYPGGDLWFDRSDFGTGIADNPGPARIVPTVQALARIGGARLVFSNPVAGEIRLSVYDAGGRLVTRANRFSSAGSQSWDITVPASGIYFAAIDGSHRIGTAKFAATR